MRDDFGNTLDLFLVLFILCVMGCVCFQVLEAAARIWKG